MAQYLLLYHDLKPARRRIDRLEREARMDLFNREISNAVLDGGSPTLHGKKVTQNEVKPLYKKPVTNYLIIEAVDKEEAIELARGAPPLHEGGTAEVYEIATEG